jgi:tRNA A-37 threonylcarbamoyl transferase component Bud32
MTESEAQARVRTFLQAQGLLSDDGAVVLTPVAGGVSSDLWKVVLPDRTICVKGALEQLKVGVDWRAPLSRNQVEYDWLRFAADICPGQVPRVIARDVKAGLFAMEYLPPDDYPVWKTQLLTGSVDIDAARGVGDLIGRLHAVSAGSSEIARRFATDENFDALRIEPYLRVTAAAHPDLDQRFAMIADRTAHTHLALVHGDVSPKNILLGAHGPVLLDAECAWFGDPAFDVAFCLTHLLIKAVKLPEHAGALGRSAHALTAAYLSHLSWEPTERFVARAASLLPAIVLARVDGQSRLDYLSRQQVDQVRTLGRALMQDPALTIAAVIDEWVTAAMLEAG